MGYLPYQLVIAGFLTHQQYGRLLFILANLRPVWHRPTASFGGWVGSDHSIAVRRSNLSLDVCSKEILGSFMGNCWYIPETDFYKNGLIYKIYTRIYIYIYSEGQKKQKSSNKK